MAKETATQDPPAVDLVKWHKTLPEWLQTLPPADTDEDVSLRIAAQIMAADTVDDVLGDDAGGMGLRDLIGTPITVHDVRLRPSDQGGALDAYALIAYTTKDSPEQQIATSGATNVIAQLCRLYQLGALPIEVTYYETPSASNPMNKVGRLRAGNAF
jgi:hypothetical protein